MIGVFLKGSLLIGRNAVSSKMTGQFPAWLHTIGLLTVFPFQISFTAIYSHAHRPAALQFVQKDMKASLAGLIGLIVGLLGVVTAASFDENMFGPTFNNGNNNGNAIDRSNEDYYQSVYREKLKHHRRQKCPTQRLEHQVIMKKYSDSTGYWVLYTQIIETRNIANMCHHNEYVYLAHLQRAGWLWNPKYNSLVQYSLGEPQFIARRVKHPSRSNVKIMVNMSRKYAPQTVDLDRIFPKRLAKSLAYIGTDDMKWSDVAKASLPVLQMTDAYFELVKPEENSGTERITVLKDHSQNQEVPE